MYVLDVMYELHIHPFIYILEFACNNIYDPKDRMQTGCSIRCML